MAVTMKVADGVVDFVDTRLAQPVTAQDRQGQMQAIKGMTQDVVVRYSMEKEDIQMELIQLAKRRSAIVEQQIKVLAQIDDRIKVLKDAEGLFAEVVEPK